MVIYCAGPIRGDTAFRKYHIEIINYVESEGHTALSEIDGQFTSHVKLNDNQIFKRDIKWIESSNIMIAEISGPSLGVGFEISYALFVKKIPVLALFNNEIENISAMITGCNSILLTIANYKNTEELKQIISTFILKVSGSE